MNAMILCAGLGSRLGDLTRATPKPMLSVNGRPLLEWLILHLKSQGIINIAVNLHFMPQVIQGYCGDGGRWGVQLRYSMESELMGTAGGARLMCERFPDWFGGSAPVLIQYGDILTDQPLAGILDQHRRTEAAATLLLHKRPGSNSVVACDQDWRVTRFLERPSEAERAGIQADWVNSALSIYSPSLLQEIPMGRACDLPRDLVCPRIGQRRIFGFPLTGYRVAIDSVERLRAAETALVAAHCRIG